jgi:hypothetical protein
MSSRQALIRAVDALKEIEGPQGATQEGAVAPAKCLMNQDRSHMDHRGHSETTDHDRDHEYADSFLPDGEQARRRISPRTYPSSVAPVAHVAPGIDSKGKNRGHTVGSCGPLWLPDSEALPNLPGVPAGWLHGVARLGGLSPARDYPPLAWQQLIGDARRFLELWGAQAAMLGWRDWELFGCHCRAPWGRIQGMGLALVLRNSEVVALTEREAALRTPRGARQTYRRKPVDPLHPAERRLVWQLQDGG